MIYESLLGFLNLIYDLCFWQENIKHNLDKICTSLPKHLASDCDRFINTYYDDLIDMLTAEAKPQEICVYMKLCLPPKRIVPGIYSVIKILLYKVADLSW